MALAIDVKDRTGSGSWVSALLIAEVLPAVAVGLAVGPYLDRFSRRRMMIGADLLRMVVFAALPFADGALPIVLLAAVAGVGSGVFRPAVYAGLPNLVDDPDLPRANSLLQAIENATWMVGPLIGGVLVTVSGPEAAYWINAATFGLSAALLAGIPQRLLQAAVAASEGHLRDLAAGFRLVRSSRALLTVFAAWNVFMLGSAGVNVSEVFLAKDALDAGDFGFGLLVGSTGLGLVIGSLAAARLLERRPVAPVYGGALLLVAAGIAAAAVSPNVWVAAAFVAVQAAANGVAVVCNALLVQRGAPDRLRGRAFTVVMSSNYAVLGLGMVVAGPLTDALGARWVWGISAGISALAALVAWTLARGIPAADLKRI